MDGSITLSLNDILRFVLYIAGIAALVYLALTLKNVVGILKKVNEKLAEHEAIIDDTVEKIPVITDNVTIITDNASKMTTDATAMIEVVKPEVEKIALTVGDVSATVDDVTRTIDETAIRLTSTVGAISDSVSDTARVISFNADNAFDVYYIFREVVQAIRDVLR